jgi:hypothetical protein
MVINVPGYRDVLARVCARQDALNDSPLLDRRVSP